MKTNWKKLLGNFGKHDVKIAAIGALALLPVCLFATLFAHEATFRDVVQGSLFYGVMFAVARRIYLNILTERSKKSSGDMYNYSVNGVHVGTISDQEYAKLKIGVYSQHQHYMGEVINFYSNAFYVFAQLIKRIPIMFFWFAVGTAYFAPDVFSSVWNSAHHMTPETVTVLLSNAGMGIGCLMLISLAVEILGGANATKVGSFGMDQELRSYFNQPAKGDVTLTRCTKSELAHTMNT